MVCTIFRILFQNSASDDEEGNNNEEAPKRWSKRLKLSEESEARKSEFERLQKSRIQRVKKTRVKRRILDSSDSSSSSESETEPEKSQESASKFKMKTRVFTSQYVNPCALRSCNKWFQKNETEIIGCELFDQRLGRCVPKSNGKPFYICASHWQHHNEDDKSTSEPEENDSQVTDNEDEDSSNEFIDDSEATELPPDVEQQRQELLQDFSKQRDEDIINKENVLESHGEYPLEIHSISNPANYVPNEVRKKRHMRNADFDQGLEETERPDESEYDIEAKEIVLLGQRVKKLPNRKPIVSMFENFCALRKCSNRFVANETVIFPVRIYRTKSQKFVFRKGTNDKPFWICFKHLQDDRDELATPKDFVEVTVEDEIDELQQALIESYEEFNRIDVES